MPASLTLFEPLRSPSDDKAAPRFVRIYSPLMFVWARRAGLQDSDGVVQDVFTLLVTKLPAFHCD